LSGKKVAITLGDPSGISPEVLVKSLDKLPKATYIIYGSKPVLDFYLKKLNSSRRINLIQSPSQAKKEGFYFINVADKFFQPAKPSKETGKASATYLYKAVEDIKKGEVQALITLPISKEYIMQSGFSFAGHTEYLADAFGVKNYCMVLMCDKLKVALITTHIPLKEVASSITTQKIVETVSLVDKELKEKFNIKTPKIAVLGLNPHAGDGGNIGDEEIKVITPAVNQLKQKGINASSPLSADTAFNRYKEFDLFVAMYHDQGLIPLKLMCFKKAVNITFGLPFVRTSPDHGTGFDIAGKMTADPSSFIEAVKLAVKLKS